MPLSLSMSLPFFTKFEAAFKVSGILQLFMLLLSAIMLDGGQLSRFMILSATAYWLAVFIIMVRRNGKATRLDQFLLKWGYPLAIVLTVFVSAIVPMGALRHS